MSVMVVVGHHMAQANFIDNISIGLCQSSSGQCLLLVLLLRNQWGPVGFDLQELQLL